MKKLFLLGVALFSVTAFAGCSKEDGAPEINSEQIVGKWRLISEVGYEIDNGNRLEWEFDEDELADIFLVLNADGQGIDGYSENARIKYQVNNSKLSLIYEDESIVVWNVAKLSTAELVLEIHDKENGGYELKQTLTYSRMAD